MARSGWWTLPCRSFVLHLSPLEHLWLGMERDPLGYQGTRATLTQSAVFLPSNTPSFWCFLLFPMLSFCYQK